MKTKLLLCLVAAQLTCAASNYVGTPVLFAPFAANDSVNAVGVLTFASPGTYVATNWNIVGPLRLAAAGDYTLIATAGSIGVTGPVVGPATGRATLRVIYQRSLSLVGATAGGVTIVDVTKTPDPGAGGAAAGAAPLTNLSTRVALGAGGGGLHRAGEGSDGGRSGRGVGGSLFGAVDLTERSTLNVQHSTLNGPIIEC